ncbi:MULTISPECIES: hypothetical protein [Paenibacillus]|uniref:hypothetical protein n=1 Tax=Paenibacillus TaxID=44249 RepID=UPI001ABF547E|nr:hypothetical protein [Paenibacillus rhizosphaerae]
MKEKVRTAVVGYGFAARTFHCPVITAVPELELAMIVQRSGHSCLQAYPSGLYRTSGKPMRIRAST